MEIAGKNILVTGGAGFIGSHIVESLVQAGANVRVIDNLSMGYIENLEGVRDQIEFIKADILDKSALDSAMQGIDIVSHQAAQLEIFRASDEPEWDLDINTKGSIFVFEAARKHGVKKVLNASSACVYGQKEGKTSESSSMLPNWTYGISKLAAEQYARLYHENHDLSICSFRYAIVYGEREWLRRALPLFLRNCLNEKAPVVFGEGSQVRDFVYVGDLVNIHNAVLQNENIVHEVFNVGSGTGTTIMELAKTISTQFYTGEVIQENIAEGEASSFIKGKKRNTAELKSMYLDIQKAKDMLNWEPNTSLVDGLTREFNWAKENKSRWHEIVTSKETK